MREKVLVIHQGALGDLVLSFPAFVSLKQEKKASVALLCSGELGKIASELNVVDAYFSLECARFCSLFHEEMTPVVKEFISDYDTIILISFSYAIEKCLRQNHSKQVHKISPRPPVEDETHVAQYIIMQLQAKGMLEDCRLPIEDCGFGTRSEMYSSLQAQPRAKSKIQIPKSTIRGLREKDLIIMHPGAGSSRKRWQVEKFIRTATIIKEMNLGKVVFVMGPAESDLRHSIKARLQGSFRIYEDYDLSYVMALMRQARCFVGNDSGVTHLAAFIGTPTVAIFGPSSPKRWSPIGRATNVLRGMADCAPCFEMDAVNCKDPQCLSGVSAEMVIDAVKEITP